MTSTLVTDLPSSVGFAPPDEGTTAPRSGPFRRAAAASLLLSVSTIGYQTTLNVTALSRATGAVAAGLGAIAVLAEGRRSRLRDAHFCVIAFGLWVCLSALWTIEFGLTATAISTVVLQVALVLLANEFAPGRRGTLRLATAYVAGTSVPIIQVLWLGIVGEHTFEDARLRLGTAAPNDLAFLLAIGIPLAWWVGYTRRRWWLLAASLYVPGAMYCIVLTASRTGFIVGVIGCVAVAGSLLAGRPRRAAIAGVIALVLTPAVGTLLPVEQVSRLATTADSLEVDGLNSRTDLWSGAWRVVGEEPLVGVGAGASRVAIYEETTFYEGAHNTPLSVLTELGAIGLLLFVAVWLTALVPAVRSLGRLDRLVAVTLSLVLVIGLQVRHWEYEKGTWLALAILVGMARPLDAKLIDDQGGIEAADQLSH